jgi:hypothetical protein
MNYPDILRKIWAAPAVFTTPHHHRKRRKIEILTAFFHIDSRGKQRYNERKKPLFGVWYVEQTAATIGRKE